MYRVFFLENPGPCGVYYPEYNAKMSTDYLPWSWKRKKSGREEKWDGTGKGEGMKTGKKYGRSENGKKTGTKTQVEIATKFHHCIIFDF